MIRKLSESWRQQKHGSSQRRNLNKAKKHATIPKIAENVSSTNKSKVSCEVSLDWGASDSIFVDDIIQRKASAQLKSPELSKNDFTRVMTRSMISTPQLKLKTSPHNKVEKRIETKEFFSSTASNPIKSPKSQDISNLNKSLQLSQWGLPDVIQSNYKSKGIKTLFHWQKECLLQGKVLDGANLIYSAPTSAGKTLVAEILMLKRVLETQKKAVYILPFVSVAREKMYSLRDQFEEGGVNVGGFMGTETPPGGFNAVDIAICTIERANSIINRLMEEGKLSSLGCVVIDEMHMIGDPTRGYLLELLLTKIRFLTAKSSLNSSTNDESMQIIGMSATLPNLDMMAKWLDAQFYFTDYRPVPLSEFLKTGKSIYDGNNKIVRQIPKELIVSGDEDDIIALCLETLKENNSVLIFCPTKNWCEKLSLTIANHFIKNVYKKDDDDEWCGPITYNESSLKDVIGELQQTPAGLDSILEKVVMAGVSYHHAGLTMDERDIVEGAYRRGVLKIIIATSTLSSGVNLPARRVIIRSPTFHGKLLDPLVYKQMVGRAGRKGVDTQGESILVCKPNEKQKALGLMTSLLKPVYSCLLNEDRSMNRALLEVIAGGVAVSPPDVELYAKSTFLNTCLSVQTGRNPEELIHTSMKFLLTNDFIKLRYQKKEDGSGNDETYYPSQLGSATLASSMKPDEALEVYAELQKARRNFCLESELHIIYQVTPTYLNDQWLDLDWCCYYNIWERLPSQSKRVAEMVGVRENFLARAMQNRISCATLEQKKVLRIHRRFYAALILQDLCNEVSIADVSRRYKVHKGLLQSLQNSSATFAGMVTVFCRKLGWTCLEVLLEQFQSRLSFGVCRDLCNLVRIPLFNRFTARCFFQNGYQTVSAIANATEKDISKLLRESTPFHSNKIDIGGDIGKQATSKCLWLSGKEGLTEQEASALIISEAKRILKSDAEALGIPVDQINVTLASSKEKINKKRQRKNRKRASQDRITPTRSSKRLSPDRENQNPDGSVSRESGSFNSRNGSGLLLKDSSLVLSDIQNITTHKFVHSNQGVISKGKLNDDLQSSTSEQKSTRHLFSTTDNGHTDSADIKMVIESAEKMVNKDGVQSKEESLNYLDSSDSLMLLSDSAFKPLNKEPKKDSNSSTTPDISLRLSTTEECVYVVPPLILHSQFNAASSSMATYQREGMKREKDSEVTSPELLSGNNSNDLFESTELFSDKGSSLSNLINSNRSLNETSNEFLVIDVASCKSLFLTFIHEWKAQSTFAISFSCESSKQPNESKACKIGRPSRSNTTRETVVEGGSIPKRLMYTRDDLFLTGLAVCWGKKDAYFIDLQNKGKLNSLDDTSLPPDVDPDLPLAFRVKSIRSVLNEHCKSAIVAYDLKEQLKVIFELCDTLVPNAILQDPKVAQWLLDPCQREKNLFGVVKQWLEEEYVCLTEGLGGGGFGTQGFGMSPKPGCSGRVRACVESVLVNELMRQLTLKLQCNELEKPFSQLEMPALRTLSVIEMNGIGFSDNECEKLKKIMKEKLASLEKQCYHLAKRTFSLTSPDDVGRVLFIDLALPYNGNRNTEIARTTRMKGKTKHFRTSKDVLEKLVKYHRLPKLILQWRRINSTLTKVVYPVQRKKKSIPEFSMNRIYCESQFHTSTGRVTFTEPNIQNVPKEFDVKISSVNENDFTEGESPGVVKAVSMRSTFIPCEGSLFVSADYSQLELRIMAHLSSDNKLVEAINTSKDVFKNIAAEINRLDVNEVTPAQRQQAKQVCYGILYGIGSKSLAEQLETSVENAAMYMEKFKKKYKGINLFIKTTIQNCRTNGYVKTISGRKRYLPTINSTDSHAKAQAERQSVNTAVQGSAADLVKTAMKRIHVKLHETFQSTCLKKGKKANTQRGAFLVLQIHDELLYEVNRKDFDTVVEIIREGMENAYQLSVRTPVKLHVGGSWGHLKDV